MELRSLEGLKVTLGIVLRGALAGLAAGLLVALGDALRAALGHRFGLLTGVIGVLAGGLLLMIALGFSIASYWMASKGRLPELRRRLLMAALWTGSAGMALGFTACVIWLVAGHPLMQE